MPMGIMPHRAEKVPPTAARATGTEERRAEIKNRPINSINNAPPFRYSARAAVRREPASSLRMGVHRASISLGATMNTTINA